MNPVYEERKENIDFIEITMDILNSARSELYLNMRFLDVALSSLAFMPDQQIQVSGTDGQYLFFQPDAVTDLFRRGRVLVNRQYLHSILHCLFSHLWNQKNRDPEYWNLACDIAVESVIDGLDIRAVHLPKSAFRRAVYRSLREYLLRYERRSGEEICEQEKTKDSADICSAPIQAEHRASGKTAAYSLDETSKQQRGVTITAERVYRYLCENYPVQSVPEQEPSKRPVSAKRKDPLYLLKREFTADDHSRWEQEQNNKKSPSPQQQHWEDLRDRMQTEMETFSKEASDDARSLQEQLQAENRKRYDYREFLRKFSVLKEEMQVDMDSFDYIFYNYGMELYGNMPLIEPLETKEVHKVEDFVIVLDTSMSCKGDLLKRFLDETYSVLSESESFFRRIHIHILQCDDQVQEDIVIANQEEMQEYLEHFTVKGFGGTDFRPAFAYVQELLARKAFTRLRGLIYFTDGYGTFPVKKPPYETAFVFMKEDYRDVDVPPWAIKLILEPEQLMSETKAEGLLHAHL